MTEKLERILPTVQKPARYVGGEYGQTMKDKRSVELRVAFCFPDTYEIGMSNLGMRILYAVMNRMEGVWCERERAYRSETTPDCRTACNGCGANCLLKGGRCDA